MSYFRLSSTIAAIAGLTVFMTPIASSAADAPDAERGYKTYMRIGCFQCHGTVGQGPISGPKLAPNPLPVEAIRAYIRAPAQVMPPYVESVLSDAEVADIHAYLESISEGPNVDDTILGD